MSTLYIVSTPIGNLKDITLRALEILKEVDVIFAEDTRVTRKLLSHFGISKLIKSYHEHSLDSVYGYAEAVLRDNGSIALVTDAGTPNISDPGSRFVSFLKERVPNIKIVPIPGASAITAALSASPVNADKFIFLGYPPHKKGRQKYFEEMKDIKIKPIVIYESPHRFLKTLDQLREVFGKEKEITVARELTKIHEEIFCDSIEKTQSHFVKEKIRGEFVIIIA